MSLSFWKGASQDGYRRWHWFNEQSLANGKRQLQLFEFKTTLLRTDGQGWPHVGINWNKSTEKSLHDPGCHSSSQSSQTISKYQSQWMRTKSTVPFTTNVSVSVCLSLSHSSSICLTNCQTHLRTWNMGQFPDGIHVEETKSTPRRTHPAGRVLQSGGKAPEILIETQRRDHAPSIGQS